MICPHLETLRWRQSFDQARFFGLRSLPVTAVQQQCSPISLEPEGCARKHSMFLFLKGLSIVPYLFCSSFHICTASTPASISLGMIKPRLVTLAFVSFISTPVSTSKIPLKSWTSKDYGPGLFSREALPLYAAKFNRPALNHSAIIGTFAAMVFILGITTTRWEEGR